jgi:hypothetical protein
MGGPKLNRHHLSIQPILPILPIMLRVSPPWDSRVRGNDEWASACSPCSPAHLAHPAHPAHPFLDASPPMLNIQH